MKRKQVLASLLMIPLTVLPVSAAEAEAVTRTAEFEAASRDAAYTAFPAEIEQDGRVFELKDIAYDILSETKLTRQEAVVHEVQSEPMYTQAMTPEPAVTIDGLAYTLKEVTYRAASVTNRRVQVSAYTEWTDIVVKPTPAPSKTASYTDAATGRTETAELPLKELQQTTELAWRPNEAITLSFAVYDAAYYRIGSRYVPYDTGKPALQGYEGEILDVLGLDPDLYVIDDIAWFGEPYEQDGVTYRDAVATGRKYCATYRATYTDTIELADAPGYIGTAVYTAEQTVETGETAYRIRATATYAPIAVEAPAGIPILPITGGAAAGGVGLFLIFWFTRRQVAYYDDAGKRIGGAHIRKGRAGITGAARKASGGITVVIHKSYARRHIGDTVQFIDKNRVLGSVTIPAGTGEVRGRI